MTNFYLDIETVPSESYKEIDKAGLEPETAKIISIQYRQLDQETAEPTGELTILKEWEQSSSEEIIVKKFKQTFIDQGIWNFVPIGNNLAFDFKFLKAKFNQYLGEERRRLGHRPFVDIKHALVIMNKGDFRGYDKLLGKSHEAEHIADWYYSKQYERIEDYIKREASSFIEKYQILLKLLPSLRPTITKTV